MKELAPAGFFPDESAAFRSIAEERSHINTAAYKRARMSRSHIELASFLCRLASHPERLSRGPLYGLERVEHVSDLFDHCRLYNRDRRPFAAIFHPYSRLTLERMKALVIWASDIGVQVCVDADSEYYPGVTLRVVLYREGEEFPTTDLT